MRRNVALLIVMLFTAATVTAPLRAAPPALEDQATPAVATSGVAAVVPIDHAEARLAIVPRLMKIGYTQQDAARAALQLTPEDLAVLLGNPQMLQKAGAMDANTRNLLVAILVVGALVALAWAGDGSIVQSDPGGSGLLF